MATRFYLPRDQGVTLPAVTPSSVWEDIGDAGTVNSYLGQGEARRVQMVTTRANSDPFVRTTTETIGTTTSALDTLALQFLSAPLAAQTISGTLKGQIRRAQAGNAANMMGQIVVRVVDSTGAERGVLYGGDTRTTNVDEMPTSTTVFTNGKLPNAGVSPVTLSSVACQDGDRVCVEIGARAINTSSTQFAHRYVVGDNNASDLTEGGTETTDLNPWLEFSHTFSFQGSATPQTAPLTGAATDETTGTLTASPGSVSVALTGLSTDEATGTLGASVGGVTRALTGLSTDETTGTLTASPGPVSVALTGADTDETTGTLGATQEAGPQTVVLTGAETDETTGALTASLGAVSVALAGAKSEEHPPLLAGSPLLISDYGHIEASVASAGNPQALTASPGPVSVALAGVPTDESAGTLTASAGSVSVALTGAATDETTGTLGVTQEGGPQSVPLTGAPTDETTGTLGVSVGGVSVALTGAGTDESTGTLGFTQEGGPQTVPLSGASTDEMVGVLVASAGSVSVALTGVPSDEMAGSVVILGPTTGIPKSAVWRVTDKPVAIAMVGGKPQAVWAVRPKPTATWTVEEKPVATWNVASV